MHRVRYVIDGATHTVFSPDGLLVLPEGAQQALGAPGIALAFAHAILLREDGPRALFPGQAIELGGVTLSWEPDRTTARPFFGVDPTRSSDPKDDVTSDFLLIDEAGTSYAVGVTPLLIGRHPACDVVLGDTRVSSFHAVALRAAEGIHVLDLRSKNGTSVDGVTMHRAVLRGRATLMFGRSRLSLSTAEVRPALVPPRSAKMKHVFDLVFRLAPAPVPVLLQGESGVGKEVVARRLHELSGRTGAFVALNGALLTKNLAASELFGHVRGAFTGADRDHDGAFVAAQGGTLFLDEVAELSLEVQAELLRAVELSRVRKVGDHREIPVDTRIVSASHADLPTLVRAGRFRADHYHRLAVVPVHIPPLRERPEDVVAIAEHFLLSQSPPRRLSTQAAQKLRDHAWPGNVRELLNTLRRAVVFSHADLVGVEDLELGPVVGRGASDTPLTDLIYERVIAAYANTGGSVAATAKLLGLRRSVVHRILREEQRAKTGKLWVHEAEPDI